MNDGLGLGLAAAAAAVGSLHTVAPDHWVPFAAVARAQGWSAGRTARITLLCGFGHVTVSAGLGFAALLFGVTLLESLGRRLESVAGLLLVGFGLIYGVWGLRRAAGHRLHGHTHRHYDHVHDPAATTAWALLLLFSADPCVAVVPLLFAAASLGWGTAVAVVVVYEVATIATMIALVLPARAAAGRVAGPLSGRYADAWAGGVVAAVGLAMLGLGW